MPRRDPWFLLLTLALLLPAAAAAQGADVEPNGTCATAQAFGAVSLPFTVDGSLDPAPGAGDVDYFSFSLPAGSSVVIDHQGVSTGHGSLADPLLGVLASDCSFLAADDDGGVGLNSHAGATVPGDGVLIVAATAYPDYAFAGAESSGSYVLTLDALRAIGSVSGRVISAVDGTPLPGDSPPFSFVYLVRCDEYGCYQFVGYLAPDSDGRFRFETDYLGGPIEEGTFQLYAWADGYEFLASDLFEVGEGEPFDAGDLALSPLPFIGSLSGRLVDAISGEPLRGGQPPWAYVVAERCEAGSCWFAAYGIPDSEGNFSFDGRLSFLLAGTYRITGFADQYQPGSSALFEVAQDEHRDIGLLGLTPVPIQLIEVLPCADLPPTGGTCRFAVRLRNGLPGRTKGQTWGQVAGYGVNDLTWTTQFQVGRQGTVNPMPQKLNLEGGEAALVDFEFDVPGSVRDGAFLCASVLVGTGPNPLYSTVAQSYGFCFQKGVAGLQLVPEKEARQRLRELQRLERRDGRPPGGPPR